MPFKNRKMGPFLLIIVIFLILLMISVHAFGAILFSNMVFGTFLLHNPILYVLIGLVSGAFILFKFKHVLSHMHRRKESR